MILAHLTSRDITPSDFNRFQEISRDFNIFQKISKDYKRFQEISRDFKELQKISRNFTNISKYLNKGLTNRPNECTLTSSDFSDFMRLLTSNYSKGV